MIAEIVSKIVLTAIFHLTSGFTSEKFYWQWVFWKQNNYRESIRLRRPIRKKIYPRELQALTFQNAHILEVGSGPLSDLAYGVETNRIRVTAIDPLANEYKKIFNTHHLTYPIIPEYGNAEKMEYKKNTFDLVYCRNALDHTQQPRQAVREMIRVLKPNGYLYISGNIKEGTKNHWLGLHKQNLTIENNDIISYKKNGRCTNLTQPYKIKKVFYKKTPKPPYGWFTIIYKKVS